jgi:hypothetical protein
MIVMGRDVFPSTLNTEEVLFVFQPESFLEVRCGMSVERRESGVAEEEEENHSCKMEGNASG